MALKSSTALKVLVILLAVVFQSFLNVNGVQASSKRGATSQLITQTTSAGNNSSPDQTLGLIILKNLIGGYKKTDSHYLTLVTAAICAVLWLLGGGIWMISTATFCTRTRNNNININGGGNSTTTRSNQNKKKTILVAVTIIFLTILCTVSSGAVVGSNLLLLSTAKTAVNNVVGVVDRETRHVYNTTQVIRDISTNLSSVYHSDPRVYGLLANTSNTVDLQVSAARGKVDNMRFSIGKGLQIAQLTTILIISLHLVAVISVTIFGFLGLRRPLRAFVVICWILAAFWFLLFGIYFAMEKIEGDTCTALWDDSISGTIGPCKQLLAADEALHNFSKGVHSLVNFANTRLSTSLYGDGVRICNPFSAPPKHSYQPVEKCPKNTLTIGQAAHLLHIIRPCPPSHFSCHLDTMVGYLNSVDSLVRIYPDLENLAECRPIKDAISEIVNTHCQPLKKYTKMVWASLLPLAITTMLVLLIWIFVQPHHQQQSPEDPPPYSMDIDLMEAGQLHATNQGAAIKS